MRVVDPGHCYKLKSLDGGESQKLVFVKREGPGYPGNVGRHAGTILQEVWRASIERLKYVDAQITHPCNQQAIGHLRSALYLLERRAAERHGVSIKVQEGQIEAWITQENGHVLWEKKGDVSWKSKNFLKSVSRAVQDGMKMVFRIGRR